MFIEPIIDKPFAEDSLSTNLNSLKIKAKVLFF